MNLRREVLLRRDKPPTTSAASVLVGVVAFIVAAGLLIGPRRQLGFVESKSDIAGATVKKYAYEAYPTWCQSHPDTQCPQSLHVLNEYMNNKDIKDPWGSEYEMYCNTRGIVVHSRGEDRLRYTPDDVWSH